MPLTAPLAAESGPAAVPRTLLGRPAMSAYLSVRAWRTIATKASWTPGG